MDFWNLMIKKDDVIISTAESLRKLKTNLSGKNCAIRKKMHAFPPVGVGKDLYVLLNAPS